jgi:hypothetical protein
MLEDSIFRPEFLKAQEAGTVGCRSIVAETPGKCWQGGQGDNGKEQTARVQRGIVVGNNPEPVKQVAAGEQAGTLPSFLFVKP